MLFVHFFGHGSYGTQNEQDAVLDAKTMQDGSKPDSGVFPNNANGTASSGGMVTADNVIKKDNQPSEQAKDVPENIKNSKWIGRKLALLSSPQAIREQIEKDIEAMPVLGMDDILSSKDPNKSLLDHLKNNPCQENSEDFVISSCGDLKIFQEKLQKLNYKTLYKILYNKHIKTKGCKGQRTFTRFGVYNFSGDLLRDVVTGEVDFPKRYSCANGAYEDMTHLLDINLWVSVAEFAGKLDNIVMGVIWSNFFLDRNKYLKDFSMDSNLIIGIDDKISKGENLIFKL